MFNPNDIVDYIPHSFYETDKDWGERCDGFLIYDRPELSDEIKYAGKYIWKCNKCGKEVLLDFSKSHTLIYQNMKFKSALKKWWRQLICKHDYKNEVYPYGIRCVCKKCGKSFWL